MMLCKWEALPDNMRLDAVRPYYDLLSQKRLSLAVKRLFDFGTALVLLVLLAPVILILSVIVRLDSKGAAIYSQERVTQYGRSFKIYKFRTMVEGADRLGAQVTSGNDSRITKVGRVLRKTRLDELPQLFNILAGDMSLVGTRPEVPRYVREYTPEMMATLLLPAGVTGETSILFKDEAAVLDEAEDVDKT